MHNYLSSSDSSDSSDSDYSSSSDDEGINTMQDEYEINRVRGKRYRIKEKLRKEKDGTDKKKKLQKDLEKIKDRMNRKKKLMKKRSKKLNNCATSNISQYRLRYPDDKEQDVQQALYNDCSVGQNRYHGGNSNPYVPNIGPIASNVRLNQIMMNGRPGFQRNNYANFRTDARLNNYNQLSAAANSTIGTNPLASVDFNTIPPNESLNSFKDSWIERMREETKRNIKSESDSKPSLPSLSYASTPYTSPYASTPLPRTKNNPLPSGGRSSVRTVRT